MDDNTKSLIKKTLLGLVLGSTAASAYALATDDDGTDNGKAEADNRIVVPLSRAHFMKALGRGAKSAPARLENKKTETSSNATAETVVKRDVGKMTPQELLAFKKSLLRSASPLRKAAAAPESIGKTESVSTASTNIRKRGELLSAQPRDAKGRFACDNAKCASSWDNIKGEVKDYVGLTGGLFAGTIATKALYDRIAVNRKKREVEAARRAYVRLLNREVTDVDEPYYKSAQDHRSWFEGAVGKTLSLGVGTAALSGLVMYRIMENRRKQLEREADKDTSRFPKDKSVEFKFV